MQRTCRLLSRGSNHYDTPSTTTTICMGATTSSSLSYRTHSAQADQGLAHKARPITSFFRTWAAPLLTVFGALIFELTKITFPDVRDSYQFRTWCINSGKHCLPRTPPNTCSWCHKTCPASSLLFPQSGFTKLFKFSFIDMIKWLDYVMCHTGLYMKSSQTIGDACSRANGAVKQKFHGFFAKKICSYSSALSSATATLRSMDTCLDRNEASPWISGCSSSLQPCRNR